MRFSTIITLIIPAFINGQPINEDYGGNQKIQKPDTYIRSFDESMYDFDSATLSPVREENSNLNATRINAIEVATRISVDQAVGINSQDGVTTESPSEANENKSTKDSMITEQQVSTLPRVTSSYHRYDSVSDDESILVQTMTTGEKSVVTMDSFQDISDMMETGNTIVSTIQPTSDFIREPRTESTGITRTEGVLNETTWPETSKTSNRDESTTEIESVASTESIYSSELTAQESTKYFELNSQSTLQTTQSSSESVVTQVPAIMTIPQVSENVEAATDFPTVNQNDFIIPHIESTTILPNLTQEIDYETDSTIEPSSQTSSIRQTEAPSTEKLIPIVSTQSIIESSTVVDESHTEPLEASTDYRDNHSTMLIPSNAETSTMTEMASYPWNIHQTDEEYSDLKHTPIVVSTTPASTGLDPHDGDQATEEFDETNLITTFTDTLPAILTTSSYPTISTQGSTRNPIEATIDSVTGMPSTHNESFDSTHESFETTEPISLTTNDQHEIITSEPSEVTKLSSFETTTLETIKITTIEAIETTTWNSSETTTSKPLRSTTASSIETPSWDVFATTNMEVTSEPFLTTTINPIRTQDLETPTTINSLEMTTMNSFEATKLDSFETTMLEPLGTTTLSSGETTSLAEFVSTEIGSIETTSHNPIETLSPEPFGSTTESLLEMTTINSLSTTEAGSFVTTTLEPLRITSSFKITESEAIRTTTVDSFKTTSSGFLSTTTEKPFEITTSEPFETTMDSKSSKKTTSEPFGTTTFKPSETPISEPSTTTTTEPSDKTTSEPFGTTLEPIERTTFDSLTIASSESFETTEPQPARTTSEPIEETKSESTRTTTIEPFKKTTSELARSTTMEPPYWTENILQKTTFEPDHPEVSTHVEPEVKTSSNEKDENFGIKIPCNCSDEVNNKNCLGTCPSNSGGKAMKLVDRITLQIGMMLTVRENVLYLFLSFTLVMALLGMGITVCRIQRRKRRAAQRNFNLIYQDLFDVDNKTMQWLKDNGYESSIL